jgi:hypothetical protein
MVDVEKDWERIQSATPLQSLLPDFIYPCTHAATFPMQERSCFAKKFSEAWQQPVSTPLHSHPWKITRFNRSKQNTIAVCERPDGRLQKED